MTAEVAVLNAMGVALAADSAVSIGPNADKIYSSADKLFNLSTRLPPLESWSTEMPRYLASPGKRLLRLTGPNRDGSCFQHWPNIGMIFFGSFSQIEKYFQHHCKSCMA